MADHSESPPTSAPYGAWHSPIKAADLTAGSVDLTQPVVDGPDLYWLEGRPSEGGRVVLVRRTPDGETHDVTPPPFNVRSRVHEYGGGAYDVVGGVVVFSNYLDQRVYRMELNDPGGAQSPIAITPRGALRYGDLRLDVPGRAVYAVCEDHTGVGESASEPVNRLVRLGLESDNDDGGVVLVDGHDFFSSPTLSPGRGQLAWVQWDHPHMPWDETELCVADISDDGIISGERTVGGGPGESAFQPRWAADGLLLFLSDRTGWWNLYAAPVATAPGEAVPLWPEPYDFADPQWGLGMSSYGIAGSGVLLCTWTVDGYARVGVLDLATGERTTLETDVSTVSALCVRRDVAFLSVGYVDRPTALVRMDLGEPGEWEVVRTSTSYRIDPAFISVPEPVTWRNSAGQDVHGFYLPPRNPSYAAPDGDLPPLLVLSHGGPTSMTKPALRPENLYWTTRGIGVLQVNYGGSSGYGRAYRERLRGQWGIVDVDDCTSGALAMAEAAKADRRRLAIRGGSAGGYTTLAALAFRDVFAAGASMFGIGDLETLARDTHKFESRYIDGLVGPYPEARDRYVERSPIHHVDSIRCPMLLLQGTADPVVPPSQAEAMAEAVRAKGLPVALLLFEGEGHGFRRAESVVRALEAEAYFYSRVFGFELAEPVEPVDIDNLP
jgi:dipeptidyl aminopeptidase/acylaminoacyl peptidase